MLSWNVFFSLFLVYLMTLPNYIASNNWMVMNNNLERMSKLMVVT
jgi:hypothetical protein